MSEDRDPATGQFAPAEPLTGLAGIEADAGYVPLADDNTSVEDTSPLTIEQAVESLPPDVDAIAGTPEAEVKTYGTFLDDLDENVSITLEQAAEITSREKEAEEKALEDAEQAKIRAEVDKLRGVQSDPDADAIDAVEGLEEETRRALKIPQVRQAIEAEFAEANQVREQHTATVQAGQQMLQATLASLAPQLQAVPLEHWAQAIQQMAQTDPVRAELVADTLDKWSRLQFAQQQDQQQRAQIAHQQFEQHVRSEDQRLVQMLGSEKVADEANRALFTYLDDHGVAKDQRLNILVSNPVLRTAEARQTIWEAQKYRTMMKAGKPAPTTRVPTVQRPGTSNVSRSSDPSAKMQSLEKQLSTATGEKAARISADIWALERNR
jgi:hypothetical protein